MKCFEFGLYPNAMMLFSQSTLSIQSAYSFGGLSVSHFWNSLTLKKFAQESFKDEN